MYHIQPPHLTELDPVHLASITDSNNSPPVMHIFDKESLRGSQPLILIPQHLSEYNPPVAENMINYEEGVCTPHLFESLDGIANASFFRKNHDGADNRRSLDDSSPTKNKHVYKYDPQMQMRIENSSSSSVSSSSASYRKPKAIAMSSKKPRKYGNNLQNL